MAYRVVPDRQGLINIGKLKENLVTEVELPAPGFAGGSYVVLLRRPKEDTAYPVSSRHEGNALIWTVQTADTAIAGTGKLECRWYGDNGEVAKSQTYMVRITDGLPDPTEAPKAWEGYIGQVAQNAQAAQTAAGEAKANADGAAASAGIAQGAAAEAGNLARAAGEAANAAASAASAASRAQAGAETAGQNARAAAEAAETARSGAETAKLSAAESATGAAGSAEAAAQAAQKGENLYNQVKADLAAGKLKGEKGDKGDPGKDAPQIDDNTVSADSPWSSRHIVETLCPPIAESGNPVTCYPVAGYPLGVVASWEPTQAGEGEPYPAGGGKNVIPYPANSHKYPQSRNGLTVTSNANGSYTVNGTATASTYFSVCDLTKLGIDDFGAFAISGCPKGGAINKFYLAMYDGAKWTSDTGDGNTGTIGTIATGARIEITIAAGYTANNLVFWPQLEKGSTPTAYAPYENIRPISGRDAVSVERCGVNLLDTLKYPPNGYNLAGKNILKPNTIYTFSPIKSSNIAFAVFLTDSIEPAESKRQMNLTGIYCNEGASVTFTTPNETSEFSYIWIAGAKDGIHLVWPDVKFMLAVATTAPAAYTPYRGDTLNLALPRTVYGGEVDAVMGDGTENVKIITVDGDKIKFTGTGDYWNLPLYSAPGIGVGSAIWCSHFDSKRFIINTRYSFIFTSPGRMTGLFASAAELSAYCVAQAAAGTPVQVAYKLAESAPFQATGNGPLLPIPGETNTIMTDADSVTITGRADPAHAIAALQAQLAVATQQLEETQQAMVSTTAMAVDYIYEQDSKIFGGEDDDDQTDAVPT